MSAILILNKIREHFPEMAENIDITHLANSNNIQHYLSLLACQIPNVSYDHMHKICERQQKVVLHKIQEIKDVDIYHEIALINPSLNLRELSMQQVSKKISYLRPQNSSICGEQEEEAQMQFQIRSHRSEYQNRQHQLKNILQDEDHSHNWWNEAKLFQFN